MEMEHWDDGYNQADTHYYFGDYEQTDNEYDIVDELAQSRLNALKLETEMDKIRNDIVNTCKSKHGNDLYQLKINYSKIVDQLEKETSIFNDLLNDLNENDFINNSSHNICEVTENLQPASVHSDVYGEQQQLYNDVNVPVNTLDWNYSVESTAETKTNITIENNKKQSNSMKRRLRRKQANNTNNIRPTATHSKPKSDKPKAKLNSYVILNQTDGKNVQNVKDMKPKRKMNSNAIYSSVLLFCKETCNQNGNALRNYLIECGQWSTDIIEKITFRNGNYNNTYALVRVRADMKNIMDGINRINEYLYHNAIQIFKGYNNRNDTNINACNVLYVNNFDILGKNTIRKMSKLFLKYGELERDIRMGTDRVNDPYAIVYFKRVKDAKKCVEKELKFGGKVLSVKFSKFGN